MSIETKARNKRLVQLAVTTALATTALTGCTGKVAPSHAYSAAHAEAALKKGKDEKAVRYAEEAVLASPRDAYTRTLLGNAYLEGGRFQSAATTFSEAIELGDTAPRTVISYALALTAAGDHAGAIDTLRQYETGLDKADFGLAVALAGRPDEGVHVLSNALRSGQNTPKVRQNLAYAYAMQGDWRSARLMVAEDVPGDKVGDRMAEWASMISPEQFQLRVARLLGVEAANDPGQPAQLALANYPSVDMLAAETVDEPVAAPQSDFAMAGELPAVDGNAQPVDSGEAALADAGLAPTIGGIRFVSNEVAQHAPASAKPAAPRVAEAAPVARKAPSRPTLASGDYNIQLGSFSSMSDAQNAWKIFRKRYPDLDDAERVITKARVNGKIYYRVAAAGYAKSSAQSLCRTVKGQGGGCIAYASSRPLPGSLGEIGKEEVRVATR